MSTPALVAVFALALDLVALARLTSFITLLVFTIVNSLLLVLKLRGGTQTPRFELPIGVPVAAILSCLLFIANCLLPTSCFHYPGCKQSCRLRAWVMILSLFVKSRIRITDRVFALVKQVTSTFSAQQS